MAESEPQPEPDIEGHIEALQELHEEIPDCPECRHLNALAAACRSLRERAEEAERERDQAVILYEAGYQKVKEVERELAEVGMRGSPPPEGSYIQRLLSRIAAMEKALAGAHVKGCIRLYCGDDTIKIPEQHDPRCLALRGGKIEPNRRELE